MHSRKVDNKTITNTFNNDMFGISSKTGADLAKRELATIYEVKDLGDPTFILGMSIHRDPTTRSIALSQKMYLKQVLKHCNMADCNPQPHTITLWYCPHS